VTYGSQNVLCPFYKDETSITIRCEGLISDACVETFANKKEKREHWKKYCCSEYKVCPLATFLYGKYEFEI